jgi:hypothetical protein
VSWFDNNAFDAFTAALNADANDVENVVGTDMELFSEFGHAMPAKIRTFAQGRQMCGCCLNEPGNPAVCYETQPDFRP